MRLSFAIRAALIALTATIGLTTAAYADSGKIRFNVIKAGFVFGGSAGKGTLAFHGRNYPLAIGGVSWGFTFGARRPISLARSATSGGRPMLMASRRGRGRRRGRSRRRCDRANQPERRGAGAVGSSGRADCRRRPQRAGHLDAVKAPPANCDGIHAIRRIGQSWARVPPKPKSIPPIFISSNWPPASVVTAIHLHIRVFFE